MAKPLGIGIIGVSADGGWAREAHVPAVRAVDGIELVAVATSRQESADAAAAAFDVPVGYGDARDLIADAAVDVVTVAAPVPAHHALITAALAAGTHVYTEWPVGANRAQTTELTSAADAADAAGVHVAVGLQALRNPATVTAGEILSAGRIGRVLSVSVLSTTAGFGPVVPESQLYLEDPASGMNLATIQLAHTLDLVDTLLGPATDVSAMFSTQFAELAVGDPPRPHTRVTPDHVSLRGRLAHHAPLTMEVVGGRPATDTPFRLEVRGTDGLLTLSGGAPRGFQSGVLELVVTAGDGRVTTIESGSVPAQPDSVVNVAGVYRALVADIAHGTTTAPDFAHALRLSRLLDDL